ncbi:PEP-CTERM sorting domain-containing protein [Massilia consociata]|uniref:PEP-CTERM sorting domain-containing protein n=1 Tax=Massilia consociata TaxID=760117 RepID=A0ABV6FHH9_9BURK
MKLLKSLLLTVGVAMSFAAQAATINFSDYSGSLASVGDVHFSLAGDGEQGTPSVEGGYLFNSIDGPTYPTNSILKLAFDKNVTGVKFVFDIFGYRTTPTWSLYDANRTLISSGSLSTHADTFYDVSQFSNVRSLEFYNGGNNWYFGIKQLEYAVQAVQVPEPGILPLLGLGIAGFMMARRRSAAK